METEEVLQVPIFLRTNHIRDELKYQTKKFVSENPIHEFCNTRRKIVSVDITSVVLPYSVGNFGFEPVFRMEDVKALQCDCEFVLNESEKFQRIDLVPNTWSTIEQNFQKENPGFSLAEPILTPVLY